MNHVTTAKFPMLLFLGASLLAAMHAFAQEQSPLSLEVTGEDRIAATTLTWSRYHMLLTKSAKAAGISPDSANVKLKTRTTAPPPATTLPVPPAGTFFYPLDMEKVVSTGKTIGSAAAHPMSSP